MPEPMNDADLAAFRAKLDEYVPHQGEYDPCPACLSPVGQRHDEGCDWERCPHCGDQTICCGNCYDTLAGAALPALLARLDAAEAERDRLRELIVEMGDADGGAKAGTPCTGRSVLSIALPSRTVLRFWNTAREIRAALAPTEADHA